MRARILSLPVIALALLPACSGGSNSSTSEATSAETATATADSGDTADSAGSEASTADGGLVVLTVAPGDADDVTADAAQRVKPTVELPKQTPTTLVATDLVAGSGPAAKAGSTVKLNYVVVLSRDGAEVDNSYDRGTPFELVLGSGGVIEGFDQGLVGVQEGTRRQIDIPADLAYGANGKPPAVGPNEPLTFVVDVLEVSA